MLTATDISKRSRTEPTRSASASPSPSSCCAYAPLLIGVFYGCPSAWRTKSPFCLLSLGQDDFQHYYNEHRTHAGRQGYPPVMGFNAITHWQISELLSKAKALSRLIYSEKSSSTAQIAAFLLAFLAMAERGGFEPPVQVLARTTV